MPEAEFWRVHVNESDPLGAMERLQDEDEVLNWGHPPNTKLFKNPSVDVGVGLSPWCATDFGTQEHVTNFWWLFGQTTALFFTENVRAVSATVCRCRWLSQIIGT